MSNFNPRCTKPNPKDFGHSAQGFIIPCCWMDRHDLPTETMDETHEALFSEHLHLSNNERKCSGHVPKNVTDWER